jgi:hypothetical protein
MARYHNRNISTECPHAFSSADRLMCSSRLLGRTYSSVASLDKHRSQQLCADSTLPLVLNCLLLLGILCGGGMLWHARMNGLEGGEWVKRPAAAPSEPSSISPSSLPPPLLPPPSAPSPSLPLPSAPSPSLLPPSSQSSALPPPSSPSPALPPPPSLSPPPPSLSPPPPTTLLPNLLVSSSSCLWWCSQNHEPWAHKCLHFSSCFGCPACSKPPPLPLPPPPLQPAWYSASCSADTTVEPLFTGPNRSHIAWCTWSNGCCAHATPAVCQDPSHLRIADDSATCTTSCCSAQTPVYLRPGKTGSMHTVDYFGVQRCGCAQPAFHDVLMTPDSVFHIPSSRPSVTVIREPCDRAASLLAYWKERADQKGTALWHPIQLVRTLAAFATFLQTHWHNITATPWAYHIPTQEIYITGWPQSWYVGPCTQVLCYENLDSDLSRFCNARSTRVRSTPIGSHAGDPFRQLKPSHQRVSRGELHRPECVAIRRLYAEDTAIHDRHCSF